MSKTTFFIPTWSGEIGALKVKKQLMDQGVPEKLICFIKEKISRSISLNRAILACTTPYMGILDDDIIIADNAVEVLEELLDKYPHVGLAIAPVQQAEKLAKPKPDCPPHATDEVSLENQSSKMWTLNCVIYRKSLGIMFDESYFGSQLLDWDFGLELLNRGFLSLADHRTAVMHQTTSFEQKNMFYHAVVARSRHIFMTKWKNRNEWHGLGHAGTIPTLEELTHASETFLIQYIAQYDGPGLASCWFNPRFSNNKNFQIFNINFTNVFNNTKSLFNPFVNDMNSPPIFK